MYITLTRITVCEIYVCYKYNVDCDTKALYIYNSMQYF